MDDSELFPHISDDQAAAIGHIAARWSLIEEKLAYLIAGLLELRPKVGHAVTAELSYFHRTTIITTLVRLIGRSDWIDTWAALAQHLEEIRPERNNAIHSVWHVVEPEHWGMRMKAKGEVKVTFGPVETKELHALSAKINEIDAELSKFTNALIVGKAHEALKTFDQSGPPPKPPQARAQKRQEPSRPPKGERKLERKRRHKARLEEKGSEQGET